MANGDIFADLGLGDIMAAGVGLLSAFTDTGVVATEEPDFGDTPVFDDPGAPGGPDVVIDGGEMNGEGMMIPTAGALGPAIGAVGAATMSLARILSGRVPGLAAAIWRGSNGVWVRMRDLWPLTRKYGPYAVAAALGIGVDQLGRLLAEAPRTSGRRRRGRGISYADIRRTRRTIKQLRKMARLAGIRTGGGYRGYYRPRRRRYY